MSFNDKLNKVKMNSKPAKQQVKPTETDGNSIGKNVKYSEDDILNAGITRDYKSAKEQKDIEAIRKERKLARRVSDRIENNKKMNGK